MQIPIWLTVKNIYKTISGNLFRFVSLPTVFLLSLSYINSYLKNQIESSSALFIPYMVCFIPLWIMICISTPLIISLMQKYLITGDNQLSCNKIVPRLNKKQCNYISFNLYIYFYVYLFPQLVPIIFGGTIIMLMGSIINPVSIALCIITVVAIFIIFIFSLITGLGASLVHCYLSVKNTKLNFKQLIEVSRTTLMGNKWRIFFITIISSIMFSIFIGFSKIDWITIFNLQQYNIFYYLTKVFINYIIILTYASVNTHIYLFFKEQFEANLAEITAKAEVDMITSNKLPQ